MNPLLARGLAAAALLAAAACGGGGPAAPTAGEAASVAAPDDAGAAGAAGDAALDVAPPCPFDAETVSQLVERPLQERSTCDYSDGIAVVSITTASAGTGRLTLDGAREWAAQRYASVTDLGDRGFLAIDELEALASVVLPTGSYTVTAASLDLDSAGYERVMTRLLEALPGYGS
jgi:hypothetical protein